MTPEERNLLTGFLNDLAQARAGTKDAEAETLINRALAANPDAAYLLVQHTILSDQALHQAQDQIAQLKARLQGQQGPAQSASFLGGGGQNSGQSGYGYGQGPGSTAVPPTGGGYGAPPPGYGAAGYAPPPPQPFSGGGGLGSFLRSAGTMAAGVAGGEMLFSGLSGLFGGGHGGGFGGGMGGGFGGMGGGGFGGPTVENVTVNNYGDDIDDGDDGYDDDGDDGN